MGAQEVIALAAGLHPATTPGAGAGAHSTLSWVLYVAEWASMVILITVAVVSAVNPRRRSAVRVLLAAWTVTVAVTIASVVVV